MRAAIIFALAGALALSSPSHADVTAVCPTLTPGVTLHGRYIQEQHLKGLTAPLKTEGDFVVAPNLGIIWRSEQPVRSVTVITAAGMERIVNGNDIHRLASAKIPAFAHMYELLDRAMMGDWSAMQKDFTLEYTGTRRAWRIILTPLRSAGPLAARLTSIVMTGDGRIDTVDINRTNGDFEHVAFVNQVVSRAPLDGPDAHLLHDKWE
ncbi:MAG: hypothetical protein IVW54_04940 [Candidatus Binataceae bacterium]|nr:hypothetical protein [Candidatus Binataceae bacterium]